MAKKIAAKPAENVGIGCLIKRQREALGMTVAQLAKRVEVSRNTITNYESNKTEPNASDLMRLCEALGCRFSDLLGGSSESPPPRFAFRAHAPLRGNPDIAISARRYLRAYADIETITDSRLPSRLSAYGNGGDTPLTEVEIDSAADTLRQRSGLHDNGPENILSVLEGLGVRTLFLEHDAKGLDGISTIQSDMMLVMLRDLPVVERTIFSAAHELGHLYLHPYLFTSEASDTQAAVKRYEREANRFAGSFLVPGDDLVRVWREERLQRHTLFDSLLLLKRVFHVSFGCLYQRVVQMRLHTPMPPAVFINDLKRRLGINRTAKMEELEPDPLDSHVLYRSNRFSRLVRSAFIQGLIGESRVAEMFQVPIEKAKDITAEWLKPSYAFIEDSTA